MSDPTIDPVEEANQQRKAEHEADDDEESPVVNTLEEAVEPLVRPFAQERLTEEEVEMQREETDAEERNP
jgi:hypothetical protein